MNNKKNLFLLLVIASMGTVSADSHLLRLQHNPFAKPDILKFKPVTAVKNSPASQKPEKIKLNLIATLVSNNAPMVIANGELIALGEKIDGLKLVDVREGEATFQKGRKKYVFKIGESDEK